MKQWTAVYGGNVILVENRIYSERLYVNSELQDERTGLTTSSRLWGRLETGETIKVSIGGIFIMDCKIFINDKSLPIER